MASEVFLPLRLLSGKLVPGPDVYSNKACCIGNVELLRTTCPGVQSKLYLNPLAQLPRFGKFTLPLVMHKYPVTVSRKQGTHHNCP